MTKLRLDTITQKTEGPAEPLFSAFQLLAFADLIEQRE
ncbi:hypothetical protein PS723_04970 [Pseudomonas fluorescens]|uniref:Uncharacterized protein n=1 Tax=Pseudomonas fluorescens TaxID=294 RepID=A0A5E7EUX8_PSEFL|nr:hypothetical protein PS723_04970 [Pseudomonas fluorescens]